MSRSWEFRKGCRLTSPFRRYIYRAMGGGAEVLSTTLANREVSTSWIRGANGLECPGAGATWNSFSMRLALRWGFPPQRTRTIPWSSVTSNGTPFLIGTSTAKYCADFALISACQESAGDTIAISKTRWVIFALVTSPPPTTQ